MVISDFNISDVSFEKLPEDKEVTLVMHGKVFQFDSNFSINGIFKDNEETYYMALLPLKAISAFPLGMIFKNQKLFNVKDTLRVMDIKLNFEKKLYEPLKVSDIPELQKAMSGIPDQIGRYNVKWQIMDQNVFKFTEINSGIDIIIPSYEIARWFYLKSSSMTRQVLASNLEGLYEEIKYIDEDQLKAHMTLKYGASNDDAEEIFRFAMDEFANIMFTSFSIDLSASIYENKEKKFKSMNLMANFPVYGEIDFKVRGFMINNNTYFVYHIMEENSDYPYEELEVIREISMNSKKRKKVAQIKKKKVKASPKTKEAKPNSAFEEIQITKDSDEFSLIELRRGLDRKKTEFTNVLVVNDNEQLDLEKKLEDSDIVVDISFNDNNAKGDYETVRAELIGDNDNNDIQRRSNVLEYFIDMLFLLQEVEDKKEDPRTIGVIQSELLLPQKDPNSKDKKRWLKSKLADNKTRRKYIIAHIEIGSENYYAIEVEKDADLEKLSTLLLKSANNEKIPKAKIREFMKSFVENNGKWESVYTDFLNTTLVHPKEDDNGNYSKEDNKNWAKRLLEKIDKLV